MVNHQEAIREVFVAVLRLCAQAGLVSVGGIAIDGTKIGSDAALDRNHSSEWIRGQIETILAEAVETDADEHAQPGLLDIDELPVELATPNGRLAALQAALAVIEAEDATAAEQAAERAAKARAEAAQGRKLRGRKPTDPHAALARAEADDQAVRVRTEATARAKLDDSSGHELDLEDAVDNDPEVKAAAAATAAARAAADTATSATRANVTDLQSRIMKTAQGWVQGYNVQAAVTEQQIIVTAEVSQDATTSGSTSRWSPQPAPPSTPQGSTTRSAWCSPTPATGPRTTPPPTGPTGSSPPSKTTSSGVPPGTRNHRRPPARRRRPRPRRWNTGCAPKKARPPTRNAPHRRTRLRDQGQPRLPPVPPARPTTRPQRVGADGHRAQPRQAPPRHQLTSTTTTSNSCTAAHRMR